MSAPLPFDENLRWYLQDSAGALGESGVSFDPTSGGPRVLASTDPFHAKMHPRLPAVARARRLGARWRLLTATAQSVLAAYYTTRRTWPPGFELVFGGYQGVAVLLEDHELLRSWCGSVSAHKTELRKVLRRAEKLAGLAHVEWQEARDGAALEVECPPRSA